MSQCFPKSYEPFGGDINFKKNLSNYARKVDLKNATGVDISKLATKFDLASLKAEVDKLDIDQLYQNLLILAINLSNLKSKVDKSDIDKSVPAPVDLSKLSNVVKNGVVKKDGIMLRSRSNILKIKYLILLTELLRLLLMLK